MVKLSRREFLGLVGTASLFTLFGCNAETPKDEKKTMISAMALKKYELVSCENIDMLVKYRPEAKTFTATKLDVIGDSLEEVEIFHSDVIEPNDGLNNFYNEYGVINNTPAEQVFDDLYGAKNYYTIEEVSEVINHRNYQKTK